MTAEALSAFLGIAEDPLQCCRSSIARCCSQKSKLPEYVMCAAVDLHDLADDHHLPFWKPIDASMNRI